MKFKGFIFPLILLLPTFVTPKYSLAEEKIEVTPLIQTSKGLSGKSFNYLEGEPELRLLKVKIPVGLKTPIHTHPSPMLIHVTRGRLKHVRGKVINTFRAGDVFVESNNGGEHYVKSIGKKPAILHVGVISVVGLPTTINK
tara:strand:+ start:97 stop:519 length:423 start_codon:yes stop_codon:yes gene_type:complete